MELELLKNKMKITSPYNKELLQHYLKNFGVKDINILPESVLIQLSKWLSHEEEKKSSKRDIWGNWEHNFSTLNYSEPFADQLVIKHLNYTPKTIWPQNKKFAVCITHDVDAISSNQNHKTAIRWALRKKNNISKSVFLKTYLKAKYNSFKPLQKDVFWNNEKWLNFEKENNVRSTIFFMVRPKGKNLTKYDHDYLLSDSFIYENKFITVADYCKRLSNEGFEIGIHGTFNTYNNAKLLTVQKETLEHAIGKKVVSTRQHYLHYDINETPTTHKESNLKIDTTLGYNKDVGFRAGTCFPYPIINTKGKLTGTLEVPQILMDGAILGESSLNLDVEEGVKKAIGLIDKVEALGGCFTLNFHPEHFHIEKYFSLFKKIVLELKKRKPYFATLSEVKEITENL